MAGVRPVWLVDRIGAKAVVILANVWKSVSFVGILFLAGLQGIPEDLYEAARVDGANRWQQLFSITLPLLAPLIITVTIFITAGHIQTFDIIYGITQGGPGVTTSVLAHRVYVIAFQFLAFGYGSAVAIVTFLFICAMGIIGFGILRRVEAKL